MDQHHGPFSVSSLGPRQIATTGLFERKPHYLIAAFNEPVAHVLHDVPTGATYREVTEVLKNSYGDHHLEVACRSQLKRTQLVGESLQEFVATIDQLPHRAHVELPKHLISKNVAHVFAREIRERDIRQHSLLGSRKALSEAL
jgi:hypothetical protein